MLTGNKQDGEYLLGKEGLKDYKGNREGVMLVAKKEKVDKKEEVNVKIGGTQGKQQDNSPQVTVSKDQLTSGGFSIKFVKSNQPVKN